MNEIHNRRYKDYVFLNSENVRVRDCEFGDWAFGYSRDAQVRDCKFRDHAFWFSINARAEECEFRDEAFLGCNGAQVRDCKFGNREFYDAKYLSVYNPTQKIDSMFVPSSGIVVANEIGGIVVPADDYMLEASVYLVNGEIPTEAIPYIHRITPATLEEIDRIMQEGKSVRESLDVAVKLGILPKIN